MKAKKIYLIVAVEKDGLVSVVCAYSSLKSAKSACDNMNKCYGEFKFEVEPRQIF